MGESRRGGRAFVLALHVIGWFTLVVIVATWAVALLVWKVARIEEKWTAGLADGRGGRHHAPAH
ncbi:hypothetical protein ACGFNV_04910 [Streptomyces sp. NPDC048751]|uniref:hypothetical protein n=1 Tax=Streptomyces sp. NPDC048751 TaxID=3365591 RepID=UPI00371420ED